VWSAAIRYYLKEFPILNKFHVHDKVTGIAKEVSRSTMFNVAKLSILGAASEGAV
jgi:hypothetical protein